MARPLTGLEWLDEAINHCADVIVEPLHGEEEAVEGPVTVVYVAGMVNRELLWKMSKRHWMQPAFRIPMETDEERGKWFGKLFAGFAFILTRGEAFAVSVASVPGRTPEESSTEISVKGPKDGFVEEIDVNIALIRKRLRSPDLKVEKMQIGTMTQTEVALLYVASKADRSLVDYARKKLSAVQAEAFEGVSLEGYLSDRSWTLLPQIDYSGRPDFLVESLMKGRIVFISEGTPLGYIAPINLYLMLKSAEDNALPFYYVSFERLIRLFGLIATLLLPGFWIAVSAYNVDQMPFPLLATVVLSRVGLPLSSTMEMTFMLCMFELFREAGVRLPRAVGQTVAVVGGLIVGDAAIRAGLTSPTMLVVSAITAVTSFTLVNQSLIGAVTVLRFGILALSSLLGMFGFFIGLFGLLLYASTMRSFGKPFLAPISPIRWHDALSALVRLPIKKIKGPYGPHSGSAGTKGGDR